LRLVLAAFGNQLNTGSCHCSRELTSLFSEKLARLGKRVEKRGRPKKALGQKYQENRVKFTAWLLPENVSYVKGLKDYKEIANVSGFLDTLIEEHRNRG
jgi:hypothetical protein